MTVKDEVHGVTQRCLIAIAIAWVALTGAGSAIAATPEIRPGFGTPAEAVVGFLRGLQAGDVKAACAYVEPKHHSLCLTNFRDVRITGTQVVARTVEDGNRALVATTGKACLIIGVDRVCGANHNRKVDLPTSLARFDKAYANANPPGSTGEPNSYVFWIETAVRIDGRWYVP